MRSVSERTLPWRLAWTGLIRKARRRFGKGIPARLDLATFSAYAVSDPALVSAVLRDPTHDLRSPLHDIEFLKPAYNYPQELLDKLKHPEAAAAWKQRYHGVAGMMNGHWVEALAEKFHESATCWVRDERARIGDGWTELPDLCALVERLVVEAATCAMFGAKMLELNPTLADDARAFTHHAPTLFSGLPAWANRPAVRARDRMKANLVRWQRQAREHGAIDTILDDVAWEPWHGSKTFRTLQRTLTDQGILDDEARAAENLGALFGANGQPPYLATWYLIETLIDPTLKARVLKRVRIARRPPAGISAWPTVLDRAQLEDDALLQSVYAETLRLHQAMVIFRFLSGDAYSLQGWRINRGESVAVSTRTAHLNPDVWNAGTPDDPHAVDRFWADRFIVHPDDPYSGPLKKQDHRSAAKSASRSSTKGSSEKEPYFSLQGCHNSFLAFGGGRGMCPGRHFAKRVIMLTTAILLNAVRFSPPLFQSHYLDGRIR